MQTQANKVAVYELKDLPEDRVRGYHFFSLSLLRKVNAATV